VKTPPAEPHNFIALLVQLLRDELHLHLQSYGMTRLPVSADYTVYQCHGVDYVLPRVRRWNLSIIILLAWTLGRISNLVMKTVSVSGASVDLKTIDVAVSAG